MDLMDYRRKIIANSPHLSSASGAVATFSDGADLPLKSLNVDIDPVQDLHGYDSPWVAGGGKNLCPPLVDNELTSNGLTLTPNSDGTVRVHGTATNTSAVLLRMKTVSIALGAGTYTFGIGVYPTNNKVYAQCVYSGGSIYARVAPATITFNDAVTITRIDIGVNAASGENIDITLYPQLEKGSTATVYAPYENICRISGWNGVKVTRTGKNLYSRENGEYNVPVFDASGNSQPYPDVNVVWIKVKPNTAYTTTLIPNSSRAAYARWIECDEYKNFIWRDSNMNSGSYLTRTRTTRSNTRWVQIACNQYQTAQISNNAWEIMFVEGSTATPYEPYNGATVTVQLGETVYGGTLNPLTGVLTVDRAMVDLGTLIWGADSNRPGVFYTGIKDLRPRTDAICSAYKNKNVSVSTSDDFYISTWESYGKGVFIRDTNYSDSSATDFKSAMSGVQLVYELATPYEIQLTPQQVRSLYGQNNIFADTGNVALDYWAHP